MSKLLKAPAASADLSRLPKALSAVFPLKTQHRKELPFAVRDLSRLLTQERGQSQAYWAHPRFVGAYLYYFLPWNLQRLTWLMPNLPLNLHEGDQILDLGSGPLTLPVGLWFSRPELRAMNLHITCADTAPRPMELGRALLDALAQSQGSEPWKISLMRGSLEQALRKLKSKVNLISAGNVLNELSVPRHKTLEDRLEELFSSMDRALATGGQIFLLEPGTRLGGKLITLMRQVALEQGYIIEAPCPHQGPCPYEVNHEQDEQEKDRFRQPKASGWCHFSLPAEGAYPELAELSSRAKLQKDRLHLSCLLLRKPEQQSMPEKAGSSLPVRIISDPIRLPGQDAARYACSKLGLVLLQSASRFASGEIVEATLPAEDAKKDPKSGALILRAKNRH